jgi:predicted heme/steroid binding protein
MAWTQDDPISPKDLLQYDGSDPSKPIYVAIKGRVFDVSAKKEMYGKGAGYNIFAGKDASKGLGACGGRAALMRFHRHVIPRSQGCRSRLFEPERIADADAESVADVFRKGGFRCTGVRYGLTGAAIQYHWYGQGRVMEWWLVYRRDEECSIYPLYGPRSLIPEQR